MPTRELELVNQTLQSPWWALEQEPPIQTLRIPMLPVLVLEIQTQTLP